MREYKETVNRAMTNARQKFRMELDDMLEAYKNDNVSLEQRIFIEKFLRNLKFSPTRLTNLEKNAIMKKTRARCARSNVRNEKFSSERRILYEKNGSVLVADVHGFYDAVFLSEREQQK
jgi:hypothetical protein